MIYFIQDTRSLEIKIGYTGSECVNTRLNALQTGNASRLEVLTCVPGEQSDETALHRMFASSRVGGEWFRPSPELLRYLAFTIIGRGMYEEGVESGRKEGRDEVALPPFLPDPFGNGDDATHGQLSRTLLVCCPVCGFDYNHIGGVKDHPNWSGNGSSVAIELNGECGHRWLLCLGFHKGNTSLYTLPNPDPEESDSDIEVPWTLPSSATPS